MSELERAAARFGVDLSPALASSVYLELVAAVRRGRENRARPDAG